MSTAGMYVSLIEVTWRTADVFECRCTITACFYSRGSIPLSLETKTKSTVPSYGQDTSTSTSQVHLPAVSPLNTIVAERTHISVTMMDRASPTSADAPETAGDAVGGAAASRDVSQPISTSSGPLLTSSASLVTGARRKGLPTSRKDAHDPRKGCACKDGICNSGSCPCYETAWECSPELCIHPTYVHPHNSTSALTVISHC